MKLPYIVTARVGTHSRAAYLITEPRITQFKQHLSFFALSSPSLPPSLQEIRGINKPIGTQIVNHYLDPWSVYVDKGYNLAALCIIFLGRLRFWFFPPLCNNQMCPMSPGTHSSLGGGFCCCCPPPAPPPPLMPEWFPAAAPVLDQPWSTSPPAGGGHI